MIVRRTLVPFAWAAAAAMLAGSSVAAEEPPSAQEARPTEGPDSARAEPEFEPGIPGLKMVDVRDHKFLWREIEELQVWERGDRISIAEFRSKVIEKTIHFLGLTGSAADQFTTVASEEVAQLRQSFLDQRRRRPSAAPGVMEDPVSSELGEAVARVTALLQKEPRHQLFAPDFKKWLLKLAFSPREAKEAKEAKDAKGAKETKTQQRKAAGERD